MTRKMLSVTSREVAILILNECILFILAYKFQLEERQGENMKFIFLN